MEVSTDLKNEGALTIQKGSKSFSFAGQFLPKENRDSAFLLYMWCRHVDDAIDESKPEETLKRLSEIRQGTIDSIQGKATDSAKPYVALSYIFKKYGIPEHYPLEMIEGQAMDVRGQEYETLKDLELYCYRVAGVVGLMMTHIMGVSDERALKNACDMGLAMQLTNIARDIRTDALLGRRYLPLQWLHQEGITIQDIVDHKKRDETLRLVRRILERAEEFYKSGDEGVPYLSFRAAWAIQSARNIYSEIGNLVLARGVKAWETRAVTSKWTKIRLVANAFVQVLAKKIKHGMPRWKPAKIETIWRFG
jgi:phytoene synthase